jgi:hypothetical protein
VRPKTIVFFERIIFGTLLLGGLEGYLGWGRALARSSSLDQNSALAVNLIIQIFSFVIGATLTLLVSCRRSKVAMWVSIALFALYLALFVSDIILAVQLETADIITITLVVLVGQGVAYGLLFTPSARRWMSRKDEKLREVFE